MNVVLSIIVKNSYRELGNIFIETLRRSLQVPYRSLILIDDGNDETKDVVKRFCDEHGKELIIERSRIYGGVSRPTRATARQTAIWRFFESFSEEWLMFLDDDAWLCEGWWCEAEKYLSDPKVGIVWGINWDGTRESANYVKALGVDYAGYLINEFYRRGGEHDTLHRRKAIEILIDRPIPPQLHMLEDAWILHTVLCQGYEARIVKVGCLHLNPGRKASWRSLWDAARWELFLGLIPSYSPAYGFYRLIRTFVSLPLNLYIGIKLFGFSKGLRRGYVRWRNKVLYRLFLFINSFRYRSRDTCSVVLGDEFVMRKEPAEL